MLPPLCIAERTGLTLPGDFGCSRIATTVVILGCVHEHGVRGLTCAACLAIIQREIDAGTFYCDDCMPVHGKCVGYVVGVRRLEVAA